MVTNEELLRQLEEERSARIAAEKLAEARLQELKRIASIGLSGSPATDSDFVSQIRDEETNYTNWLELQAEVQNEYPNPVLRTSCDGEILFANLAAQAFLLKLGQSRLKGLGRLLISHVKRLAVGKSNRAASFDSFIAGRHYHVLIYAVPEKNYFNIYMTDFTEQREAEVALQESQTLLRNIAHTIPNIVYIYDVDEDSCIYVNEQIHTVLGYDEHDVAAMEGQIFTHIVLPELLHKVKEHTSRTAMAKDGEVLDMEYQVRTKSGAIKTLFCRESVFKRKDNGQVKLVIGSAEDVTQVRQQSQELMRQKEFYESILNHIPSDVAVYNNKLEYLFTNPAAIMDPELRQWIVGKTNEDYSRHRNIPFSRMETRSKHLQRVLQVKSKVEFEEHLTDKNGNDSYHIRRLNPVLNKDREVELIIGHGLNITELRQAQEEIIASEAKNRAILAAIPDLMFIIDKNGNYLDMKNEAQKHLLVPTEDIIGNNVFNLLPHELALKFMALIAKVLKTGEHEKVDYELELPDGKRSYEGRILKYSENEILSITRDITDEKLVAQEVREKNEFIGQVLDASPSLIYVKDAEGKLILANQEFAKLHNKPLHELVGFNNHDFHINKEEADFYLEIDKQVIRENQEVRIQERFTDKNGEVQWFSTIKKPIVTSNGKVNVLGISTNITEQRLANKRLKNSEELHRLLSENSKDMVSLHHLDGSFIYVSKAVEEILGFKQEELLEKQTCHVIHPADLAAVQQQVKVEVLEKKKSLTLQHRMLRRDGSELWVETDISPILNELGEPVKFQSAARDITERRKADKSLKNSEKKYRDLINYSQAFICTHDLEGVIHSVNPYLLNMLGYTSEEMIGHNLVEFFPAENKAKFTLYLQQFSNKNLMEGVLTILDKEKEQRHLYYHNYKVEEPNMAPYIIAIAQDITDRMRTEQQLTKAKEAAEESARVKENFLANMSHEIRTPMNGILGMASLLNKTQLDDVQQNYLKIIRQSADNLLVVINDILDIAKIEAGKLELEEIPFNLADAVQVAFQTFIYKAEEKEIAYILKPLELTHTMVLGDPYRLNQVLLNLLSNAIKFTDMGSVTLDCKLLEEQEDRLTVEFSVTDTGIGIPETKIDYIFEGFSQAYSSTTRKYGGTGLGLSISKTLIEMQEGKIWVESAEDAGSTFKFVLTYMKSAEAEVTRLEEQTDYSSLGPISILLAEDNEVNIFLAQSILEGWGAKVDVAYNGREAVELAEKNDYDIVLMDIQMPELSGLDATHRIRSSENKVKANIPIIALTANALKGDAEKYLTAGMNDYVSKPFEEEKLFMKIAALLPHKRRRSSEAEADSQAPAKAAVASEPLYDLSLLEKISRGNQTFIKRTKQLFVETVPVTVSDMQQKRDQEDWTGVSAAAHKLKSTIDTMRIDKLKEVVRRIESNAKAQEDIPTVNADIEVLVEVIDQVVDQLSADLA